MKAATMDDANANWAGNITYGAAALHAPRSVPELQALVRKARKVRALGSRHSFNRIADTDADLISLKQMPRIVDMDRAARTARVDAGITYGQLSPILEAEGFALHNLASLLHISVAGAISTATHGSGDKNKNLASSVAGLSILKADGELVTLSRGDKDFDGAVVGLGALGIVTDITLDILPSFSLRQNLYLDLPFAAAVENFDALFSSAYSVSFFPTWRSDVIEQVWIKSAVEMPPSPGDLFGARAADRPWHPIGAMDPTPCTEQMGIAGVWYDRLPHFRINVTPASGHELQSEYFVPRADAAAAMRALYAIKEQIAEPLIVSEIRTIAADSLWMSMGYGGDGVAFHFSWKQDWPAVKAVLPTLEAALAPFKARPHWGKLFTMPAKQLQALYPRLADFRDLLGRTDPQGKFRNDFVDEYIFA
ncbi:MAG: FAD-binding protein [Devosia sp.]